MRKEKIKKPKPDKSKVPNTASEIKHSFKMLFIVVRKGRAEEILNTMRGFGVNYYSVCYGSGTADSEILELLGFDDNKKEIIFSIIKTDMAETIIEKVHNDFSGTGVACTVKLNSIGGYNVIKLLEGMLK